MKLKRLVSSIPSLKPLFVLNPKTGEVIKDWDSKVANLVSLVQETAQKTWDEKRKELIPLLKEANRYKPAERARQWGYKLPTPLTKPVAYSRVERLYQHKLISEADAWAKNTNKKKGPLKYSPKINLGAVDSQMCSLSVSGQELTLVWKCWDETILLVFKLPDYLITRKINKYCLPTVRVSKAGAILFDFSVEETPKNRTTQPTQRAGLDLGRAVPYTMVVLNDEDQRVAHYTTTPRLVRLNEKRERLLRNRKNILNKIQAYKTLGILEEKEELLLKEAGHLRNKIQRLGTTLAKELAHEVSERLVKHDLNTLAVEDLSWVTGAKYGSRWNHSVQQSHLTHSLTREGVRVRKVNPKNTSQVCSSCSQPITHNTKNRTVWCGDCKTRLDRDYNAALNITRKLKTYPALKRKTGDNASAQPHVIGTTHKSVSQESFLMTRMTT